MGDVSPGQWFPLYVGDYLRDTMHLTTQEHGAYLLILMAYWSRGEALPDDDRRLAATSKLQADEWQCVRDAISPFFDISGGYWHHKRMDDEIRQAIEVRRKNKERAKKAAAARYSQSSACSSQQACVEDTPPPPPPPNTSPNGEVRTKQKGASRIPDDWGPDTKAVEWIQSFGVTLDQAAPIIREFKSYWLGRSTKRKDWSLAFMRNGKVESVLIKMRNENHGNHNTSGSNDRGSAVERVRRANQEGFDSGERDITGVAERIN